jgi:hypothetical protein
LWHRRLRSFIALSGAERTLALRAIGWLWVLTLACRVLAFPRVRTIIDGRHVARREDDHWPRAVRRALKRAERTVPGTTCLTRSLTGELLLRTGGHPARLSIGVARGAGVTPAAGVTMGVGVTLGAPVTRRAASVPLDAHAWVQSGALLVAGDADLDQYVPLLVFAAES